MTSYLGRGFDSVPGRPFGWAYNREREEITAHLVRRGWDPRGLALPFRVTRIQERLHRDKPTMRERQAARPLVAWVKAEALTKAELERVLEHFVGSNDELGASIAVKVAAMIGGRG